MAEVTSGHLHVLVLNDAEVTALSDVLEDFAETVASHEGSWSETGHESVRVLRELYEALGLADYMDDLEATA